MKGPLFRWAGLMILSAGATWMLLLLSVLHPTIMGPDVYGLARYVVIRLTGIFLAAPAFVGLMLAVDFVTPGDWMKTIGNDPKASSYIMAAVVLVIGAVLCWT